MRISIDYSRHMSSKADRNGPRFNSWKWCDVVAFLRRSEKLSSTKLNMQRTSTIFAH